MPRYDFHSPRIFVHDALDAGGAIALDRMQANYLCNVMRLGEGDAVLVFNGQDGEWRCALHVTGRKAASLLPVEQVRAQPEPADLHYLFAPLKQGRLDYMVQKAVEMGVSDLVPVLTDYTQVRRVKDDRLSANVMEAAEQCGILSLPQLHPPTSIADYLKVHGDRTLIFCDEEAGGQNPLPHLSGLRGAPLSVLIGPEGGFSPPEREALLTLANVVRIPLGPRVLRADTAAVAALAVIQAAVGDWCD